MVTVWSQKRTEMAGDTWFTRAVPILEAVAEAEESNIGGIIEIADLADRTSLDALLVVTEVERLIDGGYLSGTLKKTMSGGDPRPWYVHGARVAPKGARVVGLWPPDDPYQTLVALLERRITEAPDEATRSKLRKVLDTVTRLGSDVGTNLIANVLVEVGKAGT